MERLGRTGQLSAVGLVPATDSTVYTSAHARAHTDTHAFNRRNKYTHAYTHINYLTEKAHAYTHLTEKPDGRVCTRSHTHT